MPIPSSHNARLFYRAAKQRFEDAEFLRTVERNTSAVYLAGYGIECILKALLVSAVPKSREDELIAEFRGARAHDYHWLLREYYNRGGPPMPRGLASDFLRVNTWSTDLRYSPGSIHDDDARDFHRSASEIMNWADGRLT